MRRSIHKLSPDVQRVTVQPVCDVFHIADGIIYPAFLSAQHDPVEVSIHHSGAETFEL